MTHTPTEIVVVNILEVSDIQGPIASMAILDLDPNWPHGDPVVICDQLAHISTVDRVTYEGTVIIIQANGEWSVEDEVVATLERVLNRRIILSSRTLF